MPKNLKTKQEWTSAQQDKKKNKNNDRQEGQKSKKQMRGKVHKQTRHEWDKMRNSNIVFNYIYLRSPIVYKSTEIWFKENNQSRKFYFADFYIYIVIS